jgi:RNA polymerase sigma-70 factor (ECF subfamily)
VLRAGVLRVMDVGRWGELEGALRPLVAGRVPASDVGDVLNDALLRIHQRHEAVRDGERFGAWAWRVTRSAVADYHRQRARHPSAGGGVVEELPDAGEAHDEEAREGIEQQVARYVATLVELLPEPYREAVTLTELEGLTMAEAAARAGVSLSGMKSRVQRGRERLRRMLEASCHVATDARGRVIACEPRRLDEMRHDCCK